MPELPEVETIANDLRNAKLIGRKISNIIVNWPKSIAHISPADFIKYLANQTIVSISRRGKFLTLQISNGMTLLIHLRMTGRFSLVPKEAPYSTHDHVIVKFIDDWELRFHDTRKFGRLYLVKDASEITSKLGPEPFDEGLTGHLFFQSLQEHKRQIKPLLLDQHFIAGLGNIYVDEALWEAKIHPQTLSSDIKESDAKKLLTSIRFVLKRGMQTKGTTLGTGKSNFYRLDGGRGKHQDSLSVFRKTGNPCPRCGTTIKRIVVAQRSTHICPTCQKQKNKV